MEISDDKINELCSDTKQIKIELEILKTEMVKQSHLVKVILRRNVSPREEDLVNELKTKGVMNVQVVEEFMGWKHRGNSLTNMKSLSRKNPNIRFVLGTKTPQMPSRIIWRDEADASNYEKILGLFEKHSTNRIPMIIIQRLFDIQYKAAREMADLLCAQYEGYFVDEDLNSGRSSAESVFLCKK